MSEKIKCAIKSFWKIRDGGKGVRGGQTLNGFIDLISDTINNSGLSDIQIHTGKKETQLPGYFRPHKSWDIVVISGGKLVVAIELKSQVSSIGKNFNNRSEEVLGSGIDLHSAIEENAFDSDTEVFTGYLILVENSEESRKLAQINMPYFPVMQGFLNDENTRGSVYSPNTSGKYPTVTGVSYLTRYDLLCKRLVLKKLYTAATLVVSNEQNGDLGDYDSVSPQTSVESFLMKLDNHCRVIASYQN
jgi:hypothetical protein